MSGLELLDLRRLKTLESVARLGSFTEAAHELHFSQSAVSQQIATLERDLGTRLIHRKPVALTLAGALLCTRYEAAVAELSAASAELDALRDGRVGRLRVAASTATAANLLPRSVAAVAAAHRGVDIRITPLPPGAGLAAVRRGEADLAVAHRFDAGGQPALALEETPLLRDRLTLAVPRGHRLASRQVVHLSELSDEAWIHVPDLEVPHEVMLEAMRGAPYRPVAVLAGGDLHAAQALVAARVGVALVPELDQRRDLDVAHLDIADVRVRRSVFVARVAVAETSGVVTQMVGALVGAARGVRPQLMAARSPAAGSSALRAL